MFKSRRLLRGLRTLVIVYVGIVLGMMLLETTLMYYPKVGPTDPKLAGAQNFLLHTLDNGALPAIPYWENAAAKNAPTVLFFHGNGGGLFWHVRMLNKMDSHGLHVVAMEYPGFPEGAPGTPSEKSIEANALKLYDMLQQSHPKIILWGYSLGTGVATHLASERKVQGLILEAPFTAASDVAAKMYPYLPVHLVMRNRYLSREVIAKNHAPVLILHGTADTLIPIEQGRALFRLANEPKTMKEYEGFKHYNLLDSNADNDALAFIRSLQH